MKKFNQLISEQMKTMDQLLYLQEELERCQQVEEQLLSLQNETALETIQLEILHMKNELKEIQRLFELQTKEVIALYEEKPLLT